ncbi:DUF4160 domain-containing protein [Aurantimonas sp. Leaf443]|uniref:DUF4160 domain-containing protein n=1 Tax=Aurantimonas sp. Leaf443 TaxID=1736378 RepID=UPI0007022987|nr:DUF4160 domain-containing protein [Aurantimonas sp. Leaf443]KQT85507.1 hypothetical protein ASG48_09835 [Aurantimonas sp. Leaf443]
MPTIAIVDGIRIVIFFNDHDPPHFHGFLAEHRMRIDIAAVRSMDGGGTSAAERKLLAWTQEHRETLLAAWSDAQAGRTPRRIR